MRRFGDWACRVARLSRLTFLSGIGYALFSLVCALGSVWAAFELGRKNDVFKSMVDGGSFYAIGAAMLGCVAGFVAVSAFSRRSGLLWHSLPISRGRALGDIAVCELIKAEIAYVIARVISHSSIPLIRVGSMDPKNFLRYLLLEVCYIALYFAVGFFAATVAGRTSSRVAVCLTYVVSSAWLNYYVYGMRPHMPMGDSGLAQVLRLPFICNLPVYLDNVRRCYYTSYGVMGVNAEMPLTETFFASPVYFFGMAVTAALFLFFGYHIFHRRAFERSSEAFCVPYASATVRVLLSVECAFIWELKTWLEVKDVLSLTYGFFDDYFGMRYVIELSVVFIVVSVISACGFRRALRGFWLLPVSIAVAYAAVLLFS